MLPAIVELSETHVIGPVVRVVVVLLVGSVKVRVKVPEGEPPKFQLLGSVSSRRGAAQNIRRTHGEHVGIVTEAKVGPTAHWRTGGSGLSMLIGTITVPSRTPARLVGMLNLELTFRNTVAIFSRYWSAVDRPVSETIMPWKFRLGE